MRVFHFVNREYGMEDIRKRRVKIATFDDLNDPFELLAFQQTDRTWRRSVGSMAANINNCLGMLCFSRTFQNPVQWSHYADRHRGICLGFDVPDSHLMQVAYRSERLPIPEEVLERSERLSQNTTEQFLCTKYSHWRYEREVRKFVRLPEPDPESGLYFSAFSDGLALKQVIVGALASVGREEVLDALGGLAGSVNCLRTRLAFGSYRVVKQRNEKLWK